MQSRQVMPNILMPPICSLFETRIIQVISHFHTTMGGLGKSLVFWAFLYSLDVSVSIRAYGIQTAFKATSRERIDKYTRSSCTLYDLNRCVPSIRVTHLTVPITHRTFNLGGSRLEVTLWEVSLAESWVHILCTAVIPSPLLAILDLLLIKS
jgi:hypothetical protein